MKALFIRCYGRLTPDMLCGGLIDMGVPPVYLKARLRDAGASDHFLEKANAEAQFSAHYFHIPDSGDSAPLTYGMLLEKWRGLCAASGAAWEKAGEKVLSLVRTENGEDDLRTLAVRPEDAVSLFCFLAGVEYLDAEALFTCPFEVGPGATAAGKKAESILVRAGSTAGLPIPADGISPFAAAMLEALSEDFTPMDGRFLLDSTAYGSASSESPDGENTAALYLGYFTERQDSLFGRQIKVFGTKQDLLF